jgi:putative transposase
MAIQTHFSPGEWYHCYNRGVDKRITFESEKDYERFLQILYLSNSSKRIHRSDFGPVSTEKILTTPRDTPLVEIGAFCLMPNHFHILLKEINEGGITSFMQKVGTAYTMYFNIKNERAGNLFMKPFRALHVSEDRYFQHVINYIHCNPAELYERGWKFGSVKNLKRLKDKLLAYPYSSFAIYKNNLHSLRAILTKEVFNIVRQSTPQQMLKEALEYYATVNGKATP